VKDLRQTTVDTYDNSANALAEYFRGIGPRIKYIDLAFEAAGNPKQPKILEIGCGDGRDAKELVTRGEYTGFDISKELIKLARAHVPEAHFEVADAATCNYPEGQDIVFAFASLLHLNNAEVRTVLERVGTALKPGGIFYISLKWAAEYTETIKEDKFGTRLFYLYNAEIITELAGQSYEVVQSFREVNGHTDWFEIVLKRAA
jgi:SAM-dependent methyltransferase